MKLFRLVMVATLFAAFVTPFSVSASSNTLEYDQTNGTFALSPTSDSEVILERVWIVKADDHIEIHGSGVHRTGDPSNAYSIDVNPNNLTYTTKIIPVPSDNKPQNVVTPQGILAEYDAQVRVITEDPVFINVADSEFNLTWEDDGTLGGTPSVVSKSADCTPYDGITTWYNTSCTAGPATTGFGSVTVDYSSAYYNDDWNDSDKSTYVNHSASILANNLGAWAYSWSANASGEDFLILHSRVITSGTNPPINNP